MAGNFCYRGSSNDSKRLPLLIVAFNFSKWYLVPASFSQVDCLRKWSPIEVPTEDRNILDRASEMDGLKKCFLVESVGNFIALPLKNVT